MKDGGRARKGPEEGHLAYETVRGGDAGAGAGPRERFGDGRASRVGRPRASDRPVRTTRHPRPARADGAHLLCDGTALPPGPARKCGIRSPRRRRHGRVALEREGRGRRRRDVGRAPSCLLFPPSYLGEPEGDTRPRPVPPGATVRRDGTTIRRTSGRTRYGRDPALGAPTLRDPAKALHLNRPKTELFAAVSHKN